MSEPQRFPAPAYRLGYRPALDGVRGVAIVLVLAFHAMPFTFTGGFHGVTLFFALSGFLITALLIQERAEQGRSDLKRFYIRRGLRLLPALLAVLAALWVVYLFAGDRLSATPELLAKVTLASLLYVPNWVMALELSYWPLWFSHAWSLGIEEQFYLVWPALLLLCLRARRPYAAGFALAVGLAGASMLWRAHLAVEGAGVRYLYAATDTRADALLLGCALAMVLARYGLPSRRAGWALGTTGALALALVIADSTLISTSTYLYGLSLAGLGSALVVVMALNPPRPAAAVLEWRPLVWLGRVSYGLYLWHVLVFFAVSAVPVAGALPRPVVIAIKIGLSLVVTAVSYAVVERPALRLKRRFSPRPAAAQPALQPA